MNENWLQRVHLQLHRHGIASHRSTILKWLLQRSDVLTFNTAISIILGGDAYSGLGAYSGPEMDLSIVGRDDCGDIRHARQLLCGHIRELCTPIKLFFWMARAYILAHVQYIQWMRDYSRPNSSMPSEYCDNTESSTIRSRNSLKCSFLKGKVKICRDRLWDEKRIAQCLTQFQFTGYFSMSCPLCPITFWSLPGHIRARLLNKEREVWQATAHSICELNSRKCKRLFSRRIDCEEWSVMNGKALYVMRSVRHCH